MIKIQPWAVVLFVLHVFELSQATTHWVVTENGRIQSQLDSPFYLRRSYDLLALLDQETRRNDINTLYNDLVKRKTILDRKSSNLEGASDLEARIYTQEYDCLQAGKLLSEIDLYQSIGNNGTNRKGIKLKQLLSSYGEERNNGKKEFNSSDDHLNIECADFLNMEYSMFTYEHLDVMLNRKNVTILPEVSLMDIMPIKSIHLLAKEIQLGLRENSSDTIWFYFNLATLFWRIRGDGYRAVECARRALLTVPRQYRDIPLLNLAGIFHQSKQSKDAAILLQAAIDHAPKQADNYLALGYVYAVLADYNKSIECYENFLKLNDDDSVMTAKYATLCHKKLENDLMKLHQSLQEILSDLHDYHSQQQQWLRLQERMLWEQAPLEAQIVRGQSLDKFGQLVTNRGQRCVQKHSKNSKPTITCDFTDSHVAATGSTNVHFDIAMNLQKLLKNVESETQKITQQMLRNKPKKLEPQLARIVKENLQENQKKPAPKPELKKEKKRHPAVLEEKYPNALPMVIEDMYFDAKGWPTEEECVSWNLPLSKRENLHISEYLPLENKGYQIKKMLSEYIALPEDKEHPLPWYPPLCSSNKNSGEEVEFKESKGFTDTGYLRKMLVNYVKSEQHTMEHEIGQRIVTALQKKAGPDWVLKTLASLYWRVRKNPKNAFDCLQFESTKNSELDKFKDVVLVSLASMHYEFGFLDKALELATSAYKINHSEPSTNFLLAILYYAKGNAMMAIFYLKNTLRSDINYRDGFASQLLKIWMCRLKIGGYDENYYLAESKKNDFDGVCNIDSIKCKKTRDGKDTQDFDETTLANLKTEGGKPKLIVNQHCGPKHVINTAAFGQSIPAILTEGSGGTEPDQSQLETVVDSNPQSFHMRITLGEENAASDINLGDFYVSVSVTYDPKPEATFQVHDKSGSYQLTHKGCREIRIADWLHFTSMWHLIASRNIDISSILKGKMKNEATNVKPTCDSYSSQIESVPKKLQQIVNTILKMDIIDGIPETTLKEVLTLITSDQTSPLSEIAIKLHLAMKQNRSNWILPLTSSIYWRILGDSKESIKCLKVALVKAPENMKDVPLVALAEVLAKIGLNQEALLFVNTALEKNSNFVVNHFTAGNIYANLGDLGKAIAFYRSSLKLDSQFEPARNRLEAILCSFLFDEDGSIRDPLEFDY